MDFHCGENVPKILVGNKNDEDEQSKKVVLTRYGQELAQKNNLLFFETSVKDNRNITEVFKKMTTMALQRRLGQAHESARKIVIDMESSINNPSHRRLCCST